MSGSRRRGRFRAVGSINSVAVMGGNEIDLREAEIEGGELTLNLIAFMGGAEVYVPDSIELDVGGFSFMGGHEEVGSERPPRPGAPLIRIRIYNVMGGASIYRLPPQARGVGLKEAQRLARAAERGELPPRVSRGRVPALRAGIVDHRREHRGGRWPALSERRRFRPSPSAATA